MLSAEDTIALGACTPQFREAMKARGNYALSTGFLAALDKAMARFPDGAMPRIGYCSWKDSCLINEPARSARHVLSIITRPNPRVAAALQQNAVDGRETAFFLRQWVPIPPWSEFRMFMRKRRSLRYFTILSSRSISGNRTEPGCRLQIPVRILCEIPPYLPYGNGHRGRVPAAIAGRPRCVPDRTQSPRSACGFLLLFLGRGR